MEQFEKPIIEATGGIHLAEKLMSYFRATWPLGKIEIYQDYIILKVQYVPNFILHFIQLIVNFSRTVGAHKSIPKEIKLSYDDIKGYKETNASSIIKYGITIIHTNNQYAPFLRVWLFKYKAKKIISYLNSKDIYKID